LPDRCLRNNVGMAPRIDVTHFTDPGCPFAYSALPALTTLRWRYGAQLRWREVMIGLTEERRQYAERGYTPAAMARTYQSFSRYGMPFGRQPKPAVAATARACRAVIAVRQSSPELEWPFFRALQLTQFATPLPIDEDDALRHAASMVPGVDADDVIARLDSPEVVEAYQANRRESRTAEGGPTHFQGKAANTDGDVRYTAPSLIFERLPDGAVLEGGGFQPLEAYDVLIANLDTSLERRPAPESPAEVLAEFAYGLVTREIAMCLAGTTAGADDEATETALLELAVDGKVVSRPLGDRTLWFAAGSPFSSPAR
jgi:2-hydroxychromene-2-carboxylate isomerase